MRFFPVFFLVSSFFPCETVKDLAIYGVILVSEFSCCVIISDDFCLNNSRNDRKKADEKVSSSSCIPPVLLSSFHLDS